MGHWWEAPVPANEALIKWSVVRNTDDSAAAKAIAGDGSLSISRDATDHGKATLSLDKVGSFNIIAYADYNGNGVVDPGETLRVMHLAVVDVDVENLTGTAGYDSDEAAFADMPGYPWAQMGLQLPSGRATWPVTRNGIQLPLQATIDYIGGRERWDDRVLESK